MEFESSITKFALPYQNKFIQVFTSYRITYCIINRIIYRIINRIIYCITQSYHLLYHATVSRYRITYYITLPYNLLYHATVSRTVSLIVSSTVSHTISHNRITYCIINRITQPYHLRSIYPLY